MMLLLVDTGTKKNRSKKNLPFDFCSQWKRSVSSKTTRPIWAVPGCLYSKFVSASLLFSYWSFSFRLWCLRPDWVADRMLHAAAVLVWKWAVEVPWWSSRLPDLARGFVPGNGHFWAFACPTKLPTKMIFCVYLALVAMFRNVSVRIRLS